MNPLEKLSDEEIAQRAPRERFLFGIIVDRYSPRLTRYIKRLGVNQNEDVKDILQDVFIKTFRNLLQFDTDFKFSSWIYRITHNEVMSFFRRNRIRPQAHYVEDMEKVLESIKTEDNFELGIDARLEIANVMDLVDRLDNKQKSIFVLRFLEQKSYQEISDILHIPTGTVATLLHRVRKKIINSK